MAVYCFADNKIHVDIKALQLRFKNISLDVILAIVIAHEKAHVNTGLYHLEDFSKYGMTAQDARNIELYADCLTGKFIKHNVHRFSNNELLEMESLIFQLGGSSDSTHGNGEMRLASWKAGFENGNCQIGNHPIKHKE